MSSPPKKPLEALLGGIVIATFLGFSLFAYFKSTKMIRQGYLLSARFNQVDGLLQGSETRINGVGVGQVRSITLDPSSYLAIVTFDVKPGIQIPKDSSAKIISDGLLGGKFISIVPGEEDTYLKEGDEIVLTQPPINFEGLLSQFLFSPGSGEKKEGEKKERP
jgi:phospholipid/cholesterol/gamma-HCH transport system substrate-binding protein